MVWHNITCQEEGLNVFNFPNLACLVRVSRVVADSFLREIVTLHPCQSPSMTQTNIQYHSETPLRSIIMVWHNITCQEEALNVFNFPNLACLVRVSRVVADSFLREIVTSHPCQSPSMTQTNIQYHSETPEVHHHGVA